MHCVYSILIFFFYKNGFKITKSAKGKDLLTHNGFTFSKEKNEIDFKVSLKIQILFFFFL